MMTVAVKASEKIDPTFRDVKVVNSQFLNPAESFIETLLITGWADVFSLPVLLDSKVFAWSGDHRRC